MDPMLMFHNGGVWMYAILALDILLPPLVFIVLVLALVSRVSNKMRTAALVLSVLTATAVVFPLCTGLIGWQVASNMSYQATLAAPPEVRQEMDRQGRDVASNIVNFGCCSTTAMGVPMGIALLLTARRRKRWQEVDDD